MFTCNELLEDFRFQRYRYPVKYPETQQMSWRPLEHQNLATLKSDIV